ncbi:hypothetical protein G3A43_06150 [Paraburkholderia aspalathi]|nr:hypothetical protein [Paraburkholderia aspalathi]MBK3779829.1 hypothetical protein [Paraburkholderia aspalathi]
MTQYTLIAHKPESQDYCRGCLMESYSGDFEMHHARSLDEFADSYKRYGHANGKLGHGECGYDITLLINGVPLGDIPEDIAWLAAGDNPALVALAAAARDWLTRLDAEIRGEAEETRRRAEQAEAARTRSAALAEEQRQREQYAELHAKFGGRHA